jgi:cholesterol transport system auxiliary component
MRRDYIWILCSCILLALPLLAGCLNLERSAPEKRLFVLDIAREGAARRAESEEVLRVSRFDVSPRYESRGLVYRTDEFTYKADFYNQFVISPELLITEEVRQWLADSGLFGHVTEEAGYVEEDYILRGTVVALYGDYRDRSSPQAVLEMQFVMIDPSPSGPKVDFERSYSRQTSLSAATAEVLVKGMNEALASVLLAFEGDLWEHVNRQN